MNAADRRISYLLGLPLVRWEQYANRIGQARRMELSDRLARYAIYTARLSAYLSRRNSGGKHANAVKAQNSAARKVRQALGYTYADDSISF